MNMTLVRDQYRKDGVFGGLISQDATVSLATLEHSYPTSSDNFVAKIPPGEYMCVKSQHRLEGMTDSFTTFEVRNVPGHTNILFHWGNFNKDSDGCILVGMHTAPNVDVPGESMITSSKAAFAAFMGLQSDCNTFQLTVVP